MAIPEAEAPITNGFPTVIALNPGSFKRRES
jgi:hypothetical protein